jgi:hypothetical protein
VHSEPPTPHYNERTPAHAHARTHAHTHTHTHAGAYPPTHAHAHTYAPGRIAALTLQRKAAQLCCTLSQVLRLRCPATCSGTHACTRPPHRRMSALALARTYRHHAGPPESRQNRRVGCADDHARGGDADRRKTEHGRRAEDIPSRVFHTHERRTHAVAVLNGRANSSATAAMH